MAVKYQPVKIAGYETGLVQDRENFLLPNDAYPVLQNAYVWRERIRRKQGTELLGRLRRVFTGTSLGATDGSGAFSGNIFTAATIDKAGTEPQAEIQSGSITISDGTNTYTDSEGVLTGTPGGSGTVNYNSGAVTISGGAASQPLTINFAYFPSLPVMGLRKRELNGTNVEETVAFDTKYAYRFGTQWQEFITSPGVTTTWTGTNSDFFWTTNFWTDVTTDRKLFWVTNFSGTGGDLLKYTDGTDWFTVNTASATSPFIITEAAGPIYTYLTQCLIILPFRGRLVVMNTYEGRDLANSINYPNRIRWSQIGNPIQDYNSTANPSQGSWRDNVRGKGGYIDLPTSEKIVSAGFVRDNLVIYCESSTWQLRYTGQSIAPFQYDKINTELGVESTFSSVQFDTSLVGIGDKGIVQCDSFKSDRIDVKIPDFVYQIQNNNSGTKRVHGARDFQKRLAYWIYPDQDANGTFPDKRLVYNYENDSWAIFTDSFTCLGPHQQITNRRTWAESHYTWSSQNIPWISRPSLAPLVIGGNQQGFVQILDQQASNDVSLTIQAIDGSVSPMLITSVNHNLQNGQIIEINEIPTTSPFAAELNGNRYGVQRDTSNPTNKFYLLAYNPLLMNFSTPVLLDTADYAGGGKITVLDNFKIVSKKFNYLDEGRGIQLGYFDILMNASSSGSMTLRIYVDYNDDEAVNVPPQNSYQDGFFNSNIPTFASDLHFQGGSKYFQRVFCPTYGSFVTLEFTFSDELMNGISQKSDIQIDAQVLWMRQAGRIGI